MHEDHFIPRSTAYIGLGSNLGDRFATLRSAARHVATGSWPATTLTRCSPVIETRPVGPTRYAFLNAVIEVSTAVAPEELLRLCLALEAAHGRVRISNEQGPRELDMDVLAMARDGELTAVRTASLELPHPRMTTRDFVLRPLAALAPHLTIRGRTCADWLNQVPPDECSWLRTLREPLLLPDEISATVRCSKDPSSGG